jgi:uncharacterized OsmC-like protein
MYAVTMENRGDTRYHATSRGYEFVVGPQGVGANPGDTLLAGLCACVGHYVRQFLQERKLVSHGFKIEAQAESTPDESRLASIAVWVDLRDVGLDETARGQLLASAQRCKLHNTLKAACPVTITLGKRPSQRATSSCA